MNDKNSFARNDQPQVPSGGEVRQWLSFYDYISQVLKKPKESFSKEAWMQAFRLWSDSPYAPPQKPQVGKGNTGCFLILLIHFQKWCHVYDISMSTSLSMIPKKGWIRENPMGALAEMRSWFLPTENNVNEEKKEEEAINDGASKPPTTFGVSKLKELPFELSDEDSEGSDDSVPWNPYGFVVPKKW